ncbi:MAG: hypothetical protein GY805_22465, partial [Chloroflexi bacterium]|nr:hypothetical protein [Chloroflexota bacterium]
ILHRFMVRQHHLLDPAIRWRTGVVLRHSTLSALVKADIKAATITISINSGSDSIANDRRQFLYTLRLTFADIHKSIAGTKPEEVVPIPNYPAAPPIPYQYLMDLEKNDIEEMLFIGVPQKLKVQQLLKGVTTPAMRQTGLPTGSDVLAALKEGFDKNEFHDLLLDLKIKPGALAGDSLFSKMRELVGFVERNGRLPDLVTELTSKKPFLFDASKHSR